MVCQNPARAAHEIGDGDRKLLLSAIVVWGQQDIRGDWAGDYVFCSFGCLSEWAAERATDHDGVVLREGRVEELQPAEVAALEPAAAEPVLPAVPVVAAPDTAA